MARALAQAAPRPPGPQVIDRITPWKSCFLAALIVMNGVFAMSEIALVMAKRARLARLAEEGDTGGGWR